MGMSTHVIGFKPKDYKWEQMKIIYDSCIKLGICIPKEVEDFFEGYPPDESGVRIDKLPDDCQKLYSSDCKCGIEIDIPKLPKDITIIRFYNSY